MSRQPRNFQSQPKPEKRNHWGSKKLAGIKLKRKPRKVAPGQQRLPWDGWDPPSGEIAKIAETFIRANSYNPDAALTEYDLVRYLAPDR